MELAQVHFLAIRLDVGVFPSFDQNVLLVTLHLSFTEQTKANSDMLA